MTEGSTLADRAGALISDCGLYRYRLWRRWDIYRLSALFVMLNPSTADAVADDRTIRRCVGFATSWGCGGIVVVNLFAFRATKPAALLAAGDIVGPGNDDTIRDAVAAATGPVVAAWGAEPVARHRAQAVRPMLGEQVHCLGMTKHRAPRHPLFVRGEVPLDVFP